MSIRLPRITASTSAVGATVIDQVLLSGQNFVLGALFIGFAKKLEYATYVLLFGAQLLAMSIQYAGLLMPFTATASRLTGTSRARYMDAMLTTQIILSCLLGLVSMALVSLWRSANGTGEWLAPAFACAVLGTALREYRRTEQVIEGQLKELVAADTLSILATLAGIVGCLLAGIRLTAAIVLFFSGLGCLLTSCRGLRTYQGLSDLTGRVRAAVGDLLGSARWTLPWTLLSWAQNNTYPYLIAFVGGSIAVADTAAARLVLSPVGVVVAGWTRLFLARSSSLLGRGDADEVLRRARRAAFWLGLGITLYVPVALLASIVGLLPRVTSGYDGIAILVVLWGACFLASTIRGVASTALLAFRDNKGVFLKTLVAVSASIPVMVILGAKFGAAGILIGVAAGEGFLGVLMWKALVRTEGTVVEALTGHIAGPSGGITGEPMDLWGPRK
jgi:O-antigen/teichoic acid export membrane protein